MDLQSVLFPPASDSHLPSEVLPHSNRRFREEFHSAVGREIVGREIKEQCAVVGILGLPKAGEAVVQILMIVSSVSIREPV